VERARLGRRTGAEMQGGAITITYGSFGSDAFTPVINYPEISILGVGAIRLVPVVTSAGRITPQHRISLSPQRHFCRITLRLWLATNQRPIVLASIVASRRLAAYVADVQPTNRRL
jgi:hypothetical protein